MYPSFSGMQPYVYETVESTPGFIGRCIDKLLLGASHYKVEAESSGELFLKLQGQMSFDLMNQSFLKDVFLFFLLL